MRLIDVSDFDRLADFKLALIDGFLPHNHLKKSRLSGTVRSDDSHDTVRRQHEVETVEQ